MNPQIMQMLSQMFGNQGFGLMTPQTSFPPAGGVGSSALGPSTMQRPGMGGSNVNPIMGGGGGMMAPSWGPSTAQNPNPGTFNPGASGGGLAQPNPVPPQIGMNPILSMLFGGLGGNQRFYAPNNNMPQLGGLGALLPILQGLMNPQSQQRTTQPVARQAPNEGAASPFQRPGFPPRFGGPMFGPRMNEMM